MTLFDQTEALLDKYLLGTSISPGRTVFRGHDRERSWDIKEAQGQEGASSTLKGIPIGEFEAVTTLADDTDGEDEIAEWDTFQRLLDSLTSAPEPVALPIYHSDLARNKFTEVSVKSVGGLVRDGKGGATVVVRFVEYKPPKPKPTTTATSRGDASTTSTGTGRPDPNAEAKIELAQLTDRAAEL